MKKIIDIIDEITEKAFIEAGFEAGFGHVTLSNRPDLCEYQCNGALALAKRARKKPIEIADTVAEKLKDDPAFSKVSSCMPGFINMDLSGEFLAEYIRRMALDPELSLIKDENPRRIIVDYGGANAAKPLHVGHLRSACIGESVKRIGSKMGNEMIGDVHLGDWGLQMGLIIEELKDRHQTEFTIEDLEEIYPAASHKAKETDPETGKLTPGAKEFHERALKSTALLQNGDPEAEAVWEEIMRLSRPDLENIYNALDVHFELWKGESDAQKYIAGMLDDFIKRKIAYESDGALVVDIAEEGDSKEFPPCIVRKSDGSALYATTDLATIVERERLYRPDAYIYVADLRQSLHFLSVFRVAKKAGIVRPEEELMFLGFGTVNGTDGRPLKTRDGGVMRLEYLIRDTAEAVYKKIRDTRDASEVSDEEAGRIAAIVGLAALKYGDLSNQASRDYIFDSDRFTSFDGNTGPYILYTIVRIGSILRKYPDAGESGGISLSAPDAAGIERLIDERLSGAGIDVAVLARSASESDDLKKLMLVLARYNESVQTAWQTLSPHKICQYSYELSDAFNGFYHNVKIISEKDLEKRENYIMTAAITGKVLRECIWMLGFKAPERM